MAIWGGSAVSSFAIPMAFGILVAGASSIFIAAPILLFLGDWRRRHASHAAAANDAKAADEAKAAKETKQIPAAE
jgi:SecD/SecF fusion protein